MCVPLKEKGTFIPFGHEEVCDLFDVDSYDANESGRLHKAIFLEEYGEDTFRALTFVALNTDDIEYYSIEANQADLLGSSATIRKFIEKFPKSGELLKSYIKNYDFIGPYMKNGEETHSVFDCTADAVFVAASKATYIAATDVLDQLSHANEENSDDKDVDEPPLRLKTRFDNNLQEQIYGCFFRFTNAASRRVLSLICPPNPFQVEFEKLVMETFLKRKAEAVEAETVAP